VSVDPLLGEIAGPGSGPPLSGPGVTPPALSGAGRHFLSDILVELGFVDEDQAERAVEAARHPGQTPEKVLLEGGTITEDQLARALAERYGLDHIDLGEFPVDESAAALLRQTAAKRYIAAPVGFADDGALVLAVADPADSLGLSDIAVMTKLPVRPAVAARSQIKKLLETLSFMQEPVSGASQSVSTVIIPPDGDGPGEAPAESPAEPVEVPPRAAAGDEETERELSRLREELALALVARDEALARLSSHGEQAASAAEREREEALASLRLEHERALAAAEAASEEALRAERGSAQQALSSVRAKHEEELEAERAKRVEEVETERERAATAIDAERERNQRELESLRARLTEELEAARAETEQARAEAADGRAELEKARAKREKARAEADDAAAELEKARAEAATAPPPDTGRIEQLERALAEAREQVEVTADADRRAEAARAALAALRDESERQAQVHALTERELRAELESVRADVDSLRAELPEPSQK
jgi:type II secretion system (T2SS) protein E